MTVIHINLNNCKKYVLAAGAIGMIPLGFLISSFRAVEKPAAQEAAAVAGMERDPVALVLEQVRAMESRGAGKPEIVAYLDTTIDGAKKMYLPGNEQYRVFSSHLNVLKEMRQDYENKGKIEFIP